MKSLLPAFLVVFLGLGCGDAARSPEFTSREINGVIGRMTEIMLHDVTNPPLAARFYAYACLSGYEVIAQNDTAFGSMYGVLNEYPAIKKPDSLQGYSYQLSAILAMLETAKRMQPSGKLLETYEKEILDSCKKMGFESEVLDKSMRYALYVSKQVLAYAKTDGYNKISNFNRYTPVEQEGSWYPTPPAYFAAIEPYYHTIRSFTLDSGSQFKPEPPVPFSTRKNSDFYKMMLLNYNDSITDEHRTMAAFWDCNPFAVQDNGHLLVGLKKISPGAHWMGITGIACAKGRKSFSQSLRIHTAISIGLMDGFISCWDEKYRSNRIRPETAIRKYIDVDWRPLLQTPPFPEYTSGHSTISAASASILSFYFGNNFAYTDTVEVRYGLAPRTFTSFRAAAEEAAISRFYGGIHFMDAITSGVEQGEQVGDWVLKTLETTSNRQAKSQIR